MLGSTLTYSALDPYGSSGFTDLDLYSGDGGHGLTDGVDPEGNGIFVNGLPAVGFMVYNIINTNAQPGLLANYSGVFANRASVMCRSAGLGVSPGCPAIITSPPP